MKENIIVIDSKGKYLTEHYDELIAEGYTVNVINFRESTTGEGWNPLTIPYKLYLTNKDKALDLLDKIARIIFKSKEEQDPFWSEMCVNLFCGISLYLFKKGDMKYINFYNLFHFVDDKDLLKKVFEKSCDDEIILNLVKPTILAPSETQGGILATYRQKLGLFVNRENLNNLLMETTFDLDKGSNAIIAIVNDEKEVQKKLSEILLDEIKEYTLNKYNFVDNTTNGIELKPIKHVDLVKFNIEENIKE